MDTTNNACQSAMTDTSKFHHAMPGGKVIVSLSCSDTDSLLLHRDVLIEKSPWFKACLKPEWAAHNTDAIGITRLELEFDVDEPLGFLMGKPNETPRRERARSSHTTLNAISAGSFSSGNPHLDQAMASMLQKVGMRRFAETCAIAVHKLGFALLFGLSEPLTTLQQATPTKLKSQPGFKTYVVLQLLTWLDMYGDMDCPAVLDSIEKLISGPAFLEERKHYSCLYLGIAQELESENIYKEVLDLTAIRDALDLPVPALDTGAFKTFRTSSILDTWLSVRDKLTTEDYGGNETLETRVKEHRAWIRLAQEHLRLDIDLAITRAAVCGKSIIAAHRIWESHEQQVGRRSVIRDIRNGAYDVEKVVNTNVYLTKERKNRPKTSAVIAALRDLLTAARVMIAAYDAAVEAYWKYYQYPWHHEMYDPWEDWVDPATAIVPQGPFHGPRIALRDPYGVRFYSRDPNGLNMARIVGTSFRYDSLSFMKAVVKSKIPVDPVWRDYKFDNEHALS